MSSAAIVFMSVQLLMLIAAANFHDGTDWRGCVFHGVLTSQFALVGVWLGVGDRPRLQRWSTGLLLAATLASVAVTRLNFNPWELLLASVRVIVLGVAFGRIRHKRQLVLRRSEKPTDVRLFQLTLGNLFALMFASALFLALLRLLERSPSGLYDILLVAMMLIFGLAASLVPLVVSVVALSNSNAATITSSIFAVLAVAGGLAWFAYAQTNSAETGAQWFFVPVLEAMLVATSLFAIRRCGYQLIPNTAATE